MKFEQLTDNDQFKRAVVGISLITSLLTANVYLGSSLIPFTPQSSVFDYPVLVHQALFAGFLLIHLAYLIFPRKDFIAWILLANFVILCCLDINRIQPYYINFFAFMLIPATASREARGFVVLTTIGITYMAAGISKMNPSFIIEVMPHFFGWLAEDGSSLQRFFGTYIPWGEFLLGIGLLFPLTKRKTNWLAIAMHLVIIPVKLLTNGYPVVPWNVLFLILHIAYYDSEIFKFDVGRDYKSVLLVGCFLLLPILSYAGKINYLFQFPLYSGNDLRGAVYMSDDMYNRLPEELKAYCMPVDPNTTEKVAILEYLVADQLQVAPYPDDRVYFTLAKEFLPYIKSNQDMVLWIRKGSEMQYNKNAWAYLVTDLYGK